MQLDQWMEAFEQSERSAKAGVANDDGWTVVTRKPVRIQTFIAKYVSQAEVLGCNCYCLLTRLFT